MGIAELLQNKREEILRLAGRHGVRDVRVFGSVARSEAGVESDIDFLVRLDPGVTLLEHAALVRELQALLGRKVDVISEQGLRPRIREQVLAEAVPL